MSKRTGRARELITYMLSQLPKKELVNSHAVAAMGIHAMVNLGLSDMEIIEEIDSYASQFYVKPEFEEAPF